MSRKSRALRAVAAQQDTSTLAITKLGGPADVATMIPYLLGFHPHQSLVLVALEGPRKRFGPVLRVDIDSDVALVQAQATDVMSANAVTRVLVVAFSDDPAVADPLVRRVLWGLGAKGIAVEDAFRAGQGRWWSYVCDNPDCCSPDGMPFEPATSRVAAEAVLSGLSVAADRDALRAQFAAAPGRRRAEVAREVERLRRDDPTTLPWAAAVTVAAKVARLLGSEADLTATDVAWLGLATQSRLAQDVAYGLVTRANAGRHLDLWRKVMCPLGDDLMPPVGCLTAFSAWLDGRGVLASHAIERVLEVAPRHPMARRLNHLVVNAVNPRTWEDTARPTSGRGTPPWTS